MVEDKSDECSFKNKMKHVGYGLLIGFFLGLFIYWKLTSKKKVKNVS